MRKEKHCQHNVIKINQKYIFLLKIINYKKYYTLAQIKMNCTWGTMCVYHVMFF